ncbi:MAG: hypothetical protein C0514_08200 [Candidatus Puniceispirillum sp.]|nr:hypothetical protein [Candidatus Puniceispirillum sp.]
MTRRRVSLLPPKRTISSVFVLYFGRAAKKCAIALWKIADAIRKAMTHLSKEEELMKATTHDDNDLGEMPPHALTKMKEELEEELEHLIHLERSHKNI